MNNHKETIICPECNKIQEATVKHTVPFWSYVHECITCKYIIMESEWILITDVNEYERSKSNLH